MTTTMIIPIDEIALSTTTTQSPLMLSYNDRIRPLLDAIDKLRSLNITQEGIMLPTIVVVGDQSSGKSSVLESLAGINLPRGQGICTRVPLIMRLQHHVEATPKLHLEYQDKKVTTNEKYVSEDIELATMEIAGSGKGISDTPLTLEVKKYGVPDLTMIDLPGITRVPYDGQPENIHEQIVKMIMQYIEPDESIILNVLPASVDFSTCESISLSQKVDKTGQRTLAVVTKCDQTPDGLMEKVHANDVNIGLGYVCVRNRIGDESYEEARVEESVLFDTHKLLSKIDKSMVGVPVLAQRLVQIQAMIISKCLPDIVRKISEKLQANTAEFNKLPQNVTSIAEAATGLMRIVCLSKESLRKILVRGEFDEYPDEKDMHCTARLVEMLNKYSDELQKSDETNSVDKFLMDEIQILDEAKGIALPNFLPRTAFLQVLQRKCKEISSTPVKFVEDVWDYIEKVMVRVLMTHSVSYPQLQSSMKRAIRNLCAKLKQKSIDRVMEIVEIEKVSDYTCSDEYMSECAILMAYQGQFLQVLRNYSMSTKINIGGFGMVEIGHLRTLYKVSEQAFDLKMRMTSYWKVVLKRIVDNVAMYLLFSVKKLVDKELEEVIVEEIMGPQGDGIQKMLEEAPSVAMKREKISKSIELLKESKKVVSQIIDRITGEAD